MRDYSKLLALAEKNNGYIFSKDVASLNIAKDYLKFAVQDGIIEKVAHGIYIEKDNFIDTLFVYQKVNSRVVFSAFTSAYLLDLTTRDTDIIYGSTPMNYYSKSAKGDKNVIIREKKEIYNIGITEIKTSFGNTVKVHDIHRTVCDLFSPKYVGDKFVQIEALKTYLRREDKDTIKLMTYAKLLGVDKQLREKLEVLL